jgi:dolichyl-diphosphooligosaccharide---protein glycosyltransferase
VPFVGFNVVKQAECAASHGMFIALQAIALGRYLLTAVDLGDLKRLFISAAVAAVGAVAAALVTAQLLGFVQWSGRSLTLLDPTYASKFMPIIASVSEHQPPTWTAFFFDLHLMVPLAPVGLFLLFRRPTDAAIFVIIYGTLSWYFAGVMVRLMLTLAPAACILGAIGLSELLQSLSALLAYGDSPLGGVSLRSAVQCTVQRLRSSYSNATTGSTAAGSGTTAAAARTGSSAATGSSTGTSGESSSSSSGLSRLVALVLLLGATAVLAVYGFHSSYVSSLAYSNPSIVVELRGARGSRIIYDDYREAYYWLRHNTAPDAKIMSWWDYGYQMSAMSNRTVIVDNNTWNNTHIATVGKALASTEVRLLCSIVYLCAVQSSLSKC